MKSSSVSVSIGTFGQIGFEIINSKTVKYLSTAIITIGQTQAGIRQCLVKANLSVVLKASHLLNQFSVLARYSDCSS